MSIAFSRGLAHLCPVARRRRSVSSRRCLRIQPLQTRRRRRRPTIRPSTNKRPTNGRFSIPGAGAGSGPDFVYCLALGAICSWRVVSRVEDQNGHINKVGRRSLLELKPRQAK
ncbi:hypothetical protein BT67DRAFT_120071 [Trichocladium antarcticum]|uniref:Uncharacterized protein n=1 Tax=Trichocladium antarcticum TaxID=1450529 RepID=A0AAN6US86_9PEZI|nr:hypothetical protein BT67DRAFT_120071 [Trichocladium antarcticum]